MKRLLSIVILALVMTSASYAATGCGTFSRIWAITGTVREDAAPNYSPIPGAQVELLASDSQQVCQTVYANVNGVYTFSPVYVPNYYYIRVTGAKNHVPETDLAYTYRYMSPIDFYLEVIP
jgi:hypothetical protein